MSERDNAEAYVKACQAIDQMLMNVICPPGTFALAALTALVVPPAMLWLLWELYG